MKLWKQKVFTEKSLRSELIYFRKINGFTIRDIAKMTGISNPFISQFENGSSIGLDKALKIAEAMRYTPVWHVPQRSKCKHEFGQCMDVRVCQKCYYSEELRDGEWVNVKG